MLDFSLETLQERFQTMRCGYRLFQHGTRAGCAAPGCATITRRLVLLRACVCAAQ